MDFATTAIGYFNLSRHCSPVVVKARLNSQRAPSCLGSLLAPSLHAGMHEGHGGPSSQQTAKEGGLDPQDFGEDSELDADHPTTISATFNAVLRVILLWYRASVFPQTKAPCPVYCSQLVSVMGEATVAEVCGAGMGSLDWSYTPTE